MGQLMVSRRKTITALVLALVLTAGVRADMMLVSRLGDGPARPSLDVPSSPIGPAIVELGPRRAAFVRRADVDVEPTGATQPPLRLLHHDWGSLDLCLYSLVGLGLCKSVRWVRRLSVGSIPDWYHAGGPSQVGHSHAVGPDCLCSAAACFVHPDDRAEDFMLPYRLAISPSLRRKSEFTPAVVASRGPPVS